MSGFLGVDQLGASVITLNFQGIIYLVSLGGSISTSSLIGNSLGASNPWNAKKYTNMGIILSLILSILTTLVFGLFGSQMISIFTEHIEIKSIAEGMIPLLLVILWGDYISLICGGMITAMGYQSYAIVHSIVCFWILIVPLGYVFGIWLGVPVGLVYISVAFLWLIYSSDFEELARDVVDRIRKEKMEIRESARGLDN